MTGKKEADPMASSKLNKVSWLDAHVFGFQQHKTALPVACSVSSENYSFQVTQLTGFSDPVYAEAYVHVNQYDIVLDVLIVNQTSDTLQNLTLELATLGKRTQFRTEYSVCADVDSHSLGEKNFDFPFVGTIHAVCHAVSCFLKR